MAEDYGRGGDTAGMKNWIVADNEVGSGYGSAGMTITTGPEPA